MRIENADGEVLIWDDLDGPPLTEQQQRRLAEWFENSGITATGYRLERKKDQEAQAAYALMEEEGEVPH